MQTRHPLILLRLALLASIGLSAYFLVALLRPPYMAGYLFQSRGWLAALAGGAVAILLQAGLLAASLPASGAALWRGQAAVLGFLGRLGRLNLLLLVAVVAVFAYLLLGRFGYLLESIYLRLFLFALATLAGGLFLKAAGVQAASGELLAASLLAVAAGYRLAAYLPDISSYPFTLNWSEASRYYYASLYFSERIYGLDVPPTVLHPSRYLMQALPFLIPNSPLWLHRLWQVLLWLLTAGGAAWLVTRRLAPAVGTGGRRWMLLAWAYLFILIGPIYYHLLVPFILVLAGYAGRPEQESSRAGLLRFARNLGIVLLASIWAGISRVNWFPVPGMLAAALYFLEEPVAQRPLWKYLLQPFLWTLLGTAAAFGAQAAYVWWSGNPAEQFASSLTSDLLWKRLLPNPTYPLGILPACLLVSLPVLWAVYSRLSVQLRRIHLIRLLGLAAILLVLFGGGLVVSTKIGGGSNLHNLDAYLALLLVVSVSIVFGHFTPDRPEPSGEQPARQAATGLAAFPAAAFAAALGVTALFTLLSGRPLSLPSQETTRSALETIQDYVHEAVSNGGEVLLISERQLLTFGKLPGTRLVPEYEKVFLMEMAMADNPHYMGKFHSDLQDRRFALIISEPLFGRIKDSTYVFGEENNAWVQQVSRPVLCYYRPVKFLLTDFPIQLLLPRSGESDCKENIPPGELAP